MPGRVRLTATAIAATLGAGLSSVLSVTTGSAATLSVDGGVIQVWTIPFADLGSGEKDPPDPQCERSGQAHHEDGCGRPETDVDERGQHGKEQGRSEHAQGAATGTPPDGTPQQAPPVQDPARGAEPGGFEDDGEEPESGVTAECLAPQVRSVRSQEDQETTTFVYDVKLDGEAVQGCSPSDLEVTVVASVRGAPARSASEVPPVATSPEGWTFVYDSEAGVSRWTPAEDVSPQGPLRFSVTYTGTELCSTTSAGWGIDDQGSGPAVASVTTC